MTPLPAVGDFFDEAAETTAFAGVYLPFFVAGFDKGADNVRSSRSHRAKGFGDFVRERIRRKSFEHAALAVGTTKKKLQKLLREGLDEGWGTQELAGNVRKAFDGMSRVRSLRIARTELTDVINDGSNETLRDEGHTEKEWSTVMDGQERPDHHAANGQSVPVNGVFHVGGELARYPGDEALSASQRVSCRCAIVGAGFTEDRKRRIGHAFLRAHGALERRFVVHLHKAFAAQRDRALSCLAP